MTKTVEITGWVNYFKNFTKRNMNRLVRLELFDGTGSEEVKCLPLAGVSVELKGADAPRVEIMFGGLSAASSGHLTHTIKSVRQIMEQTGNDKRDGAIEFQSKGEKVALLSFESKTGAPLGQSC
jgi:hypothetical protein